jgi:hypothetical protein
MDVSVHKLIEEGEVLIKRRAPPEEIEKWDKKVPTVIADWCQMGATQVYMRNSRKYDEPKLEDPEAAPAPLLSVKTNALTHMST